MQVVKGIDTFPGVGFNSNVYLVDGEVLVDAGLGQMFSEVKNEIVNRGFNPRDIHTIVATHHHYDHTGGLKKFRDWLRSEGSEGIVAVHSGDQGSLENGETLAEMFEERAKSVTVDLVLSDEDVIETGKSKYKLQIIHTPGHTPGSICLYEKKHKALISGDTLFADGFGRTDFHGGNAEEMRLSLERLKKLDVEYLLPGHGEAKVGGVKFLIQQILNGALGGSQRHK